MEALNKESVVRIAQSYNKAIPGSEARLNGDQILAKLSTVPEFLFYEELIKSAVNVISDSFKRLPCESVDSLALTSANLQGKLQMAERMSTLITNAISNLKKLSEREPKEKQDAARS